MVSYLRYTSPTHLESIPFQLKPKALSSIRLRSRIPHVKLSHYSNVRCQKTIYLFSIFLNIVFHEKKKFCLSLFASAVYITFRDENNNDTVSFSGVLFLGRNFYFQNFNSMHSVVLLFLDNGRRLKREAHLVSMSVNF